MATTVRAVRVPDQPWQAALARAESEGVALAELVRDWISDYAAGRRRVGPGRPGTVELSRSELSRLRDLIDALLGPKK